MNEIRFAAPWSWIVKLITVALGLLLLGVMLFNPIFMPPQTPHFVQLAMVVVPMAILAGVLPFMVRGYVLRGHELEIQRLGWVNHIDLNTLVSATANPEAMNWSIRLFGCGGMFGFFGWFRNRKLGTYRAYCTDPKRSVVLKLRDRTLVVTPDDPQKFVSEIEARHAERLRR